MKVILISGKQGSGKSTLSTNLHRYLTERGKICFTMKFADPLYEMQAAIREVAEEYGIPFEKKEGALLQLLGTEWGRKIKGENVWADACVTAVANASMNNPGAFFIIDDCRFPNELAAFPHALKLRLEASEDSRMGRADSWRMNTQHESEIALDHAVNQFDLLIKTDSWAKDATFAFALAEVNKKWGPV